MGLDLDALLVAREVVRQAFNAAAAGRVLHIPGERVSQQLLRLEDSLDTVLFDRRGNRVVGLNAEGAWLWPRLMHLLDEVDALQLALRDADDSLSPEVRLACTPQAAREVVPEALSHWPERRRGGQVRVFVGPSSALVDQLRRGEADLAVGLGLPDRYPEIALRAIRAIEPCWLLPETSRSPSLAEQERWLDGPLLSHAVGTSEWNCLATALARLGRTSVPVLQTEDLAMLQRYVLLGFGHGLIMGAPAKLADGLMALAAGNLPALGELRVGWNRARPMRVPVLSLLNLLAPGRHPFDTGD